MDTQRKEELQKIVSEMNTVVNAFYYKATHIGNHPFIEFAGVMGEYVKCCQAALESDIDFTECSKHSGKHLPMPGYAINYVNEKLDCIFTGRSVMNQVKNTIKKLEVGSNVIVMRDLYGCNESENDDIFKNWIMRVTKVDGEFCSAEHSGKEFKMIPVNSVKII